MKTGATIIRDKLVVFNVPADGSLIRNDLFSKSKYGKKDRVIAFKNSNIVLITREQNALSVKTFRADISFCVNLNCVCSFEV